MTPGDGRSRDGGTVTIRQLAFAGDESGMHETFIMNEGSTDRPTSHATIVIGMPRPWVVG